MQASPPPPANNLLTPVRPSPLCLPTAFYFLQKTMDFISTSTTDLVRYITMSSTKGGKSKSGASQAAASQNAPKTVQTRSAKAGLQV